MKRLLILILLLFGCSKYEAKLNIDYVGTWEGILYIDDYDDQHIFGTNERTYELNEVNYVSAHIVKKYGDTGEVLTIKIIKVDTGGIFGSETEYTVDSDSTILYVDYDVKVGAVINE